MRRALLCLLVLGGCAAMDADTLRRMGRLSAEPHPTTPGAYRVTYITMTHPSHPGRVYELGTPEMRAAILPALIGSRCASASITEEAPRPMGSIWTGAEHAMVVATVTCP